MIIVSRKLVYFFSIWTGRPSTAIAVTVFPFIIIRSYTEIQPWILNHEKIHLRQEAETLFIGYFIVGLFEVIYAIIWLRLSLFETYRWLSAEQEAYLNHNNLDYLKTRKMWSQFRYFKNRKQFTLDKNGVVTLNPQIFDKVRGGLEK